MAARKRRVLREVLAEIDLTGHVDYLARDEIQVAIRFIDAAEAAFKSLAEPSEPGWLWESDDPRLEGVRCWPLGGFPNHLIFYRPMPDEVRVLRVLHAARDLQAALRDHS